MLDWKQRVIDKCAQYGVACESFGDGLKVNGQLMTLTGLDGLDDSHQSSLNDLVDFRLMKLFPKELTKHMFWQHG